MWVYRGYDKDSHGRTAPRLEACLRYIQTLDPAGASLGTYAHRAVRGGSTPSVHQAGRALDWHPSSVPLGWHLWDILTHYPEGGDIQLVIWQRRQWGGRGGPTIKAYTGADPHTSHLHIETRSWA